MFIQLLLRCSLSGPLTEKGKRKEGKGGTETETKRERAGLDGINKSAGDYTTARTSRARGMDKGKQGVRKKEYHPIETLPENKGTNYIEVGKGE